MLEVRMAIMQQRIAQQTANETNGSALPSTEEESQHAATTIVTRPGEQEDSQWKYILDFSFGEGGQFINHPSLKAHLLPGFLTLFSTFLK